jgi:hypothetical protein
MDELYRRLLTVYRIVESLLNQPPVNHNPMEILYRTILEECKRTLLQALPLLQLTPINKEHLKTLLSIIYRDDEVANPTFRAWNRVSLWMKTANPYTLQWMKYQMDQIRMQLILIVPQLIRIYGTEETKYIVSAIYRE